MTAFQRLKRWAARLEREVYALYLAYRDPRVPWYAKVIAAVVVGYALSPIDLIPDPMPVLGYLDDLVLIPLGVAIAMRMIPLKVMEECRLRAREAGDRPVSRTAAVLVVMVWLAVAFLGVWLALRLAR